MGEGSVNNEEGSERSQLLQAAVRAAAQAASHPALQQVGAAALQLGVSCAAFNLTLAVTHVTAGCLRIHCGTPLLAPLWGAASVAAASVAAGHVSRSTLTALRLSFCDGGGGGSGGGGGGGGGARKDGGKGNGGNGSGGLGPGSPRSNLARALAALPRQLWASWDGREALVDALMGPFLYKVLFRQSFRRLLPSHLAQPGAFGRLHVPTSSAEYSTPAEKAQLSLIFGRDGCHHCGTRSNGVIGDHMPPYKVVKDALAAREAAGGVEKLLTRVAEFIGIRDESLKQVYYAQCRACSGRQAQLMRNGTRVTAVPGVWPPELVVHNPVRLATRPATAAILVGLRYYVDAAVRQGPGPYGGLSTADSEAANGRDTAAVSPPAPARGARRGGWRWLWEQRPRQGKELGPCGEGEVLLVLSGGGAEDEEEGNEDAGDDCGCDQRRRGFPELFDSARDFVLQLR